jgi:hypothetical protein
MVDIPAKPEIHCFRGAAGVSQSGGVLFFGGVEQGTHLLRVSGRWGVACLQMQNKAIFGSQDFSWEHHKTLEKSVFL